MLISVHNVACAVTGAVAVASGGVTGSVSAGSLGATAGVSLIGNIAAMGTASTLLRSAGSEIMAPSGRFMSS
jgi:hypothetical protein